MLYRLLICCMSYALLHVLLHLSVYFSILRFRSTSVCCLVTPYFSYSIFIDSSLVYFRRRRNVFGLQLLSEIKFAEKAYSDVDDPTTQCLDGTRTKIIESI